MLPSMQLEAVNILGVGEMKMKQKISEAGSAISDQN
jgi:hypothetical protein